LRCSGNLRYFSPWPHFRHGARPDSRWFLRPTTCLRRARSENSFTSCSWVSTSMIAGHSVAGNFCPCHSRRPAIRGDTRVPTRNARDHSAATTGLVPRASH
jgi:hypothetical protein